MSKLSLERLYRKKDIPLQEKEITENGEHIPDNGYLGFSKVLINVKNSGGGGGEKWCKCHF